MTRPTTPESFRPTPCRFPELVDTFRRVAVRLRDNPPYVLIGWYRSDTEGAWQGILGAAGCEFHARILKRELDRKGEVRIERTEHHPSGTFCLEEYKAYLREKRRKSQEEPTES